MMTLLNSLAVPHSLLVYETLLSRKNISPQEKQYYHRLRKGFIGEKRLEAFINAENHNNTITLYDCLFEQDSREFQVDCLLITARTIFLLEVKNYSGDYSMDNNKLYNFETKQEVYNPITQLERTEHFFKRLLYEMRINIDVRSYIVFINPEFMLYNATPRFPMIFLPQIKRFLQKINANALGLTDNTRNLADRLINRRKKKSSYERLPKYNLSELKRGLFCQRCFAQLVRENQYILSCPSCKEKNKLEDAILLAIAQFHLLFPQNKITTASIRDWCGDSFSRTYISKCLKSELNHINRGPYSYSEFKNEKDHLSILLKNYNYSI